MESDPYTEEIIHAFKSVAKPGNASPMKAYMKNKFEYLGIKSPERRELAKSYLIKSTRPATEKLWGIINELWGQPEREFQYFAMELFSKYNNSLEKNWIYHFEFMITQKSWWDTVDFIAATLVGNYFKKYPEMIIPITDKWMDSQNIWLQRSCLIFQLKYKTEVNTNLLASYIIPLSASKEFFIAKAIGWSLRQYSKFDPEWVMDFVNGNPLQPLSKREALRLII